jgi:hypothetical protein
MSEDIRKLYETVRAETASVMGYDAKRLTPVQAMRLDLATSLRFALDNVQTKIINGQSTDVAELVQASQTLAQLLPALSDEPSPVQREDARQRLAALIEGAKAAADHDAAAGVCSECERLRSEVSALQSVIAFMKSSGGLRDPDGPPPSPPLPEAPSSSPSPSPSSPSPSSLSPWNPPPAPSAPEPYQEGSDSTWRRYVGADGHISSTPRTRFP